MHGIAQFAGGNLPQPGVLLFEHKGAPVLHIVKATRHFEQWLGRRTTLVEADLRLKHQRMVESSFSFFRAPFYRWMQIWPEVCSKLCKAPPVLAVGDLHVENFGTWRDVDGRLVWGVSDFDEAAFVALYGRSGSAGD